MTVPGIESNWSALAVAVDAGTLYLEPETAVRCAKHCETLLEVLRDLRSRATRLATVDGMGAFPSGIALARKFGEKASGGAYSMDRALADHIAEVQRMQAVFEAIDARYRETDESAARTIVRAGL